MLKRIGSLLLCVVMAMGLMLPMTSRAVDKNSAVPTVGLASVPDGLPKTGPVQLYLTYKPGGEAPSSDQGQEDTQGYRLYYIASIRDKEGGGKEYVVTTDYAAVPDLQAELDELDPWSPWSAADNNHHHLYDKDKQDWLRTALNSHIDSGKVKPNAVNAIQKGESAFVDLPYGLYYVMAPESQAETSSGRTDYTPLNFVASLPYISADLDQNGTPIPGTEVENNFLVADMKFYTETPDPDPGGGRKPPRKPPSDGDADADADDDADADADADSDSDTDIAVDIPDENVPLDGPPEIIDIPDGDVPKTDVPEDTPEQTNIVDDNVPRSNKTKPPVTTIKDDPVPLARLPQTGLLWWPVPVMGLAGAGCIFVGAKGRNGTERKQ